MLQISHHNTEINICTHWHGYFGLTSPEKPNMGKPVEKLRVLLLCSNEIIWVQLDAKDRNPTDKNSKEKSCDEFPHLIGKSRLWPQLKLSCPN